MGTKYIIFYYLLISMQLNTTSCANKNERTKTTQKKAFVDTLSSNEEKGFDEDIDSLGVEVFHEDKVLINGKLHLSFSYEEFLDLFGKEDSITDYIRDMYSSFSDTVTTKILYKNNSKFEIYQNQLRYDAIRFNEKMFIMYENNKLTHTTSIFDFSKLFPKASKEVVEVDVFNGGIQRMISLRESENPEFEGRVNFMFKKDKLIEFHWWVP